MPKVAVLVSGGVDSSVALARLRRSGDHSLTAFYVKIWLEDELAFLGSCPWEDDLQQVRAVCGRLGVPFEVVSLQQEYLARVVDETLAELRAGRTPSPDVLCNRRVKFGAFVERVGAGFDMVASGHYARVRTAAYGRTQLLRGVDPVKDQTYFLCRLEQSQVSRCLFPIGDLAKHEVRSLARGLGLPNADRPDSQGICFLGRVPYPEFIRFHLGDTPGEIRDIDAGTSLGTHRGHWFHTVGQRRGLGLAGGPWYVVRKDVQENVIWVCHADRLPGWARRSFTVLRPRWISDPPLPGKLEVRLRHGPTTARCRLRFDGDGVAIELEQGDPGIAAGQFAAFYDGEVCLGGGAIG